MITVTNIGPKHGYSGFDHLLTNVWEDMIGREFRSVSAIRRAANAKSRINELDRRVRYVPIWVEIYLNSTGDTREVEV